VTGLQVITKQSLYLLLPTACHLLPAAGCAGHACRRSAQGAGAPGTGEAAAGSSVASSLQDINKGFALHATFCVLPSATAGTLTCYVCRPCSKSSCGNSLEA
jgi:hypothetical protein